ncbi:unnamed protein product, partial [Polarella glacialis]
LTVNNLFYGRAPPVAAPFRGAGTAAGAPIVPRPAAPAVNMAAYNDRYAGCVDGKSLVQLASGETLQMEKLVKGDLVSGQGGVAAEVLCLVKIRCPGAKSRLVQLGEHLRLTPYHPVCVEGEWRFPGDIAEASEFECDA